jgi:Flp pilus assembly pilin Flp
MSTRGLAATASRLLRSHEGQAAAEYAAILTLVAVVAVLGVGSLSTACAHLYDHIVGAFGS